MQGAGSYLICYDITDPKRLRRTYYFLKARALPIQYSVFLGRLTEERRRRLTNEIMAIIDPRKDDVRIYPVPSVCTAHIVGDDMLPRGVVLSDVALPEFLREHLRRNAAEDRRPEALIA